MANSSGVARVVWALVVFGCSAAGAQQPGPQAVAARPGDVVQGVIHRLGDDRYRFTFDTSGIASVEVSGAPVDCAFQVGSQGFQQSESAPIDWTDGQPGQTVRHSFRVQAGRPGAVWLQLRSRLASVSNPTWSGVACSSGGPWYTATERGAPAGAVPPTFEGRPVRPPISFRLVAKIDGAPESTKVSGLARGEFGGAGGVASLRDDRLGFSFDYPDEWAAVSLGRGDHRIAGRAGTPAAEAVITLKVIAKSESPGSSALQQLLTIHEQLTDGGAQLVSLGPTEIAGQTAAFASHAYDGRNSQGRTVPFDHVQLVLDHGANYFLVSFVAPHDVFVKQTAVFKQIFTTWRFLP
jgi:hypothetical protein